MNYERLQLTHIQDLAAVYGGARGRTMSSRHQAYAWRALQESGVKTIIDLREKDKTERLPALCNEYGTRYFHYPVYTTAEAIAKMVELFPQFSALLDEGDFYIACAMGLHRTDIALNAYWMFHAADMGLQPPEIRGYRQEDGHRTDKLNRVLNALYAAFTERNGVDPISQLTFKERKAIIAKKSLAD